MDSLYESYARLRSTSPCQWMEGGYWFLTKYSDVYDVLKNHDSFSSCRRVSSSRKESEPNGSKSILISDDPPLHTRIRTIVNRWFISKSVQGLRPWITQAVRCLMDELGNGRADVLEQFAEPLPTMTIAHLLGLDVATWRTLRRWSIAIVGSDELGQKDHLNDVLDAYRQIGDLIQARRALPLSDLISHVVAGPEGGGLTDSEALAFCILLLVAGNVTTVNLIANALNVLSTRPDTWKALRQGDLAASAIVSETLRFDSPVQVLRRIVKHDVSVNNIPMRRGDFVELCLGSANRDPDEFERADEFDPKRDFRRHVAFGHGIHYCLGAPLARLEAEIALTELAFRYSAISGIAAERANVYALRGFRSLILRLS
jgi:cytochrome P450